MPAGFITNTMLGNKVVKGDNIADSTIQNRSMAANSIGTSQLQDGAVATDNIADKSVVFSKLGSDVGIRISDAAPSFLSYTFLDGKLTVYKESHGNIWHIQYYDTMTEVPEGSTSFSKPLGNITGAGSTEFIAMIKRNYPNNIYRSSMFQTDRGKFFYLQIDYAGGVLASFSGSTDLKSVGLSMHDTIIGV